MLPELFQVEPDQNGQSELEKGKGNPAPVFPWDPVPVPFISFDNLRGNVTNDKIMLPKIKFILLLHVTLLLR